MRSFLLWFTEKNTKQLTEYPYQHMHTLNHILWKQEDNPKLGELKKNNT